MAKIYQFNQYRSPSADNLQAAYRDTIAYHLQSEFITFPPVFQEDLEESIDLLAVSRENDRQYRISIKADTAVHASGRLFIATQMQGKHHKPEWVFTCKADVVLLYLPQSGRLYWLNPNTLRSAVVGWLSKYRVSQEQFIGVSVPIAEVKAIAMRSEFVGTKTIPELWNKSQKAKTPI